MVKTVHSIHTIAERLNLPTDRVVPVEWAGDDHGSLAPDEVAEAVKQSLAEPLNFPPLFQATVPGDRVAVAVDDGVPFVAEIVAGMLAAIESAGVEPDAISVVTSDASLCDRLRKSLGDGCAATFVNHDPDNDDKLAFLGVIAQGSPLRVNRTIFEADLVLPVGCARLAGSLGAGGVYDTLYPRFGDRETIDRYSTPARLVSSKDRQADRREQNEAGWQFGVPMIVEVVPGGEGSVAKVLSGEPQSVAHQADKLCQQIWARHVARRADLVIATISGGSTEQRWENVARALAAAERVVADGGAVAICSNLDTRPGKSIGRLARVDDLERAVRKIRKDHTADSRTAWYLARALQRGPVFFLSRLDGETIEDIGLAPVADFDELARLANRSASCIVLDDAQHAVATVEGEES